MFGDVSQPNFRLDIDIKYKWTLFIYEWDFDLVITSEIRWYCTLWNSQSGTETGYKDPYLYTDTLYVSLKTFRFE